MIDNQLQTKVSSIINSEVPNRHSFFQLNFFILGKEPTHQAKLRRCIDELKSKKRDLDAILLEVDDLADRNQLLYWEMAHIKFSDSEEREIRTRMTDRKICANNKSVDALQDRAKNLQEEMIFFVEAFDELSKVEPMKDWDDMEVQTQYWDAKISEELAHRLLMQMPIDIEIIRTALALPKEAPVRKQVLALIQRQTEKLSLEKKDVISR